MKHGGFTVRIFYNPETKICAKIKTLQNVVQEIHDGRVECFPELNAQAKRDELKSMFTENLHQDFELFQTDDYSFGFINMVKMAKDVVDDDK